MAIGIQTWDANGVPNNTGIVPVLVAGTLYLGAGQNAGSWNYPIMAGYGLGYIMSPVTGESISGTRRRVTISGGSVTLSDAAGQYDANSFVAFECWLIVYYKAV
ncbi:hypothetical protein P0E69_09735 [Chimaeribacter arupi]|uniref:hypothetical protein n=1 Tax=Chimaeribacter arupi TaxID=2060066 RepID=UPI002711D79B|nr:hypothetical protein [Chimaeribacter arupi]WKZ94123.1 hypothetical protein P0E69_09735 [Chimaeribacter arupi]